jgi:uncharacterized protein (TIGR02147 family)
MAKPDLFAYLDYRKYLRDAFEAMRAAAPKGRGKASYRSFAKEAGYSSPNLLQLILAGERELSPANVPGTARALGLNKQETEFFADLVAFDRAGGFDEKTFHYQRMLRSRKHAEARPIDKGQFEYLDQWYHPAVRELAIHPAFDGNPAWIARRLHPRITPAQAEKSLELLQRLGLIARDPAGGRWTQTEARISTAPEVASLAVANYHRAALKLAEASIEAFDGERRDLRAVTLGIPKAKFPELKRKLEGFWREILDLADGTAPVEEIYQVNLQAFPLTRPEPPDA